METVKSKIKALTAREEELKNNLDDLQVLFESGEINEEVYEFESYGFWLSLDLVGQQLKSLRRA